VDGDRLDEILDRLRDRGGRVTTARRAIISELLRGGGHITAEELTAAVQAAHPDVHTSTVYRCLETLGELGIVEHAHLGHGPAVYHLADDTHQHLVCESCGSVLEVPAEVFAVTDARLRDEFGFTATLGHFAIVGRCAACTGLKSRRRRPTEH